MSSALSTLNTTTEVRPLSKASNPQLLPGCRSIGCPLLWCVFMVCVCVHVCSLLTAVCVHLDGLNAEHKFQVWDTILGHTSWPFLSFSFPFLKSSKKEKKCCFKSIGRLFFRGTQKNMIRRMLILLMIVNDDQGLLSSKNDKKPYKSITT